MLLLCFWWEEMLFCSWGWEMNCEQTRKQNARLQKCDEEVDDSDGDADSMKFVSRPSARSRKKWDGPRSIKISVEVNTSWWLFLVLVRHKLWRCFYWPKEYTRTLGTRTQSNVQREIENQLRSWTTTPSFAEEQAVESGFCVKRGGPTSFLQSCGWRGPVLESDDSTRSTHMNVQSVRRPGKDHFVIFFILTTSNPKNLRNPTQITTSRSLMKEAKQQQRAKHNHH